MSTTIEKSKEELQREVQALQEQAKREQQTKLLNEQNNWFFDLIDASGQKAIEKSEEKLLKAQAALKEANLALQNAKQALFLHQGSQPDERDKKGTKAWKKQLAELEKDQRNCEKQLQLKQAAVLQASEDLEKTTQSSEKAGLKTELSGDKSRQEKVVAHAKYEPLYEHRMARLDDLIKQLEDYLPATMSLLSTFNNKRNAATDALKADPKPWKTAYELLPQGKEVNEALGQMDKLWSESLDKNVSEVPAFKQLAGDIAKLRTKLAQDNVASTMSDDELANFRNALDALEKPLHKAVGAKEDVTSLAMTQGFALKKLETTINKAWEAAHDRKFDVDDKLSRAKQIVTDLARLGTEGADYAVNDKAVFERQVAVIETTCGAREFSDAGDLLDQLLPQLERTKQNVVDAFNRAKQSWAEAQRKLPELQKGLSNEAQRLQDALAVGGPAELVQRAKNLNERLKNLQSVTPGLKPTYAEAIASVEAAESEVRALRQAVAGAATFQQDLAGAKEQVAEAAAETNTEITKLEKTLREQFKTDKDPALGPVLQPLQDKARELGETWEQRIKTSTTLAELGVDAICAEYQQLTQKAADAGTVGLVASTQTITLAPAREKYARAKAQATQVAQNLMSSDPVNGVELLNRVEAADGVAIASLDPKEIESQADALLKAAQEHAQAASRAADIARGLSGLLETKLKEVTTLLADLLKDINKISSGEVQKPYAAIHVTLDTQAEELGALVGSKLVKLLESGLDEVEVLKTEIATAKQAIANEKGLLSKGRPSFGAIKGELAALTERLGDSTVKRYAVATAAELGDKITTLQKGLGSQTLTAAEKELQALQAAVKKVEEKAKAAEGKVSAFEKLVDKEKKVLEAEPFTSSAANLAKSYKGRFEALKGDATFEDGLEAAKTQLEALKDEIKGVLESPKNDLGLPILVFAGEQDALESQRKAEEDKAKFEGEVSVLKKQLAAARKNGIEARELDGLDEALESAEKAAAKGGAYADAREQIDAIRKRLALLETNPQGLIISSRNQLPGCNKFLKGEIKRFAQQTKALADTIAKAELDEAGKKTVATALGAVRGLFNPAALDPFLPIVASKDPSVDRPKRAAAREAALREVRRMMGYIDRDFRLMALSNNPFDDKMAAIISGLKLALLDVENNLLVSLPA